MSVVLGRHVLVGGAQILRNNVFGGCNVSTAMHIAKRTLFHADVLGISNYERQRASVQEKIGDLRVSFRERMENYMESDPKNTIFTDDLKTMVHVAEAEDLDTASKMVKRFHQQNDTLRFSSFVFGPLILRMFHKLKEPQKAYELFSDDSLKEFFSQMSSYVVMMDMLFENEMYEDVLKLMTFVTEQQLGGFKYPMDCVTLSTAACLKMNTAESLEKAVDLLKQSDKIQSMISLRSIVFTTLLALRQNNPALALEVMSLARSPSSGKLPLAFINIKTLVYTKLGRLEDAVQMLKTIITADTPDHVTVGNEVFQEILDELQKACESETKKEVVRDVEVVCKALDEGGHVNSESFDEYVLRPIMRKRKTQDGYKARQRNDRSRQGYRREGLMARGEHM